MATPARREATTALDHRAVSDLSGDVNSVVSVASFAVDMG
jgi:hypothetical protein